jgi:choline monooxygenase
MSADRFTHDDHLRQETYARTRAPIEYASTLVPGAYRSPTFFDVERRRVFARGWVAAAHVTAVAEPVDERTVSAAERSIILTRDRRGTLRGFQDLCRQRASRVGIDRIPDGDGDDPMFAAVEVERVSADSMRAAADG